MSAKEYREYADECLDWAKTAKSHKEREIFLQMARAWLEAAVRWEPQQAKEPWRTLPHERQPAYPTSALPPIAT